MIADLITIVVEHLKLLLCLCGIFNFKFRGKWYSYAGFMALLLAGIFSPHSRLTLLSFLVTFVCASAVEGKRRLLMSFSSFLGICLLDDLIFLVLRQVLSLPDDMAEHPYVMSAMNSVSMIIIAIIAFILHRTVYKNADVSDYSPQNADGFLPMLIIIGQVASLLFCAPYTLAQYRVSQKNIMIVGFAVILYAVVFIIVAALLIYNNVSKKKYRQLNKTNEYLVRVQKEYYELLYNKEIETRRFRHDISNHLICIQTLLLAGKYDETTEYITNLVGSISNCKPKFQTGNIVANAILNDISARYSQTELTLKGHIPGQLRISDKDISVILSNVLENAFCAASECSGGGSVCVVIKNLAGSIVLCVENDMNHSVRSRNGKLLTHKKDKQNHGFGMMNVMDCLKRNGGEMDYRYDNDRFKVEIVLPFASE